jgi:hypothetical protein
MLQDFLLLFQRFPLAPGFSTRHARDMDKTLIQSTDAADIELIRDLLCGRSVERDARYLDAKRALARMLRSSKPLDLTVRFALAELLDPDCDSQQRQLRFSFKRKGGVSDAWAEQRAAQLIQARKREGVKMEAIIWEAWEKFGLKRARVFEIWRTWQPILKRLERKGPRSCDPND